MGPIGVSPRLCVPFSANGEAMIRKFNLHARRFQPADLPHGHHERLPSPSRHLNNHRLLDVYLPPNYALEPERRFPVLYMHDGNNLYFPELAFGGMPWRVDTTLQRLLALQLIQPLIVVGIHNTLGRNSEYTWSRVATRRGFEGGEGSRYAAYLIEEVKPLIDQRYRTLPAAEHTGVMGSSLGGLISFYLGLHHPEVFTRIGMISPSLWWNQREAIADARNYRSGHRLWLDMGTREGYRRKVAENPNLHNVRALKQVLETRGYVHGVDLGYLEDRGGLHNEWWWGQRLHLPLIFFWGTAQGRRQLLKAAALA